MLSRLMGTSATKRESDIGKLVLYGSVDSLPLYAGEIPGMCTARVHFIMSDLLLQCFFSRRVCVGSVRCLRIVNVLRSRLVEVYAPSMRERVEVS